MPPKRKRPDRPAGDGGRPSPHRPGDANLAQHDGHHDGASRGRGTRGGHFAHGQRGGFNRRDSSQGYGRAGSQHHGQQHSVHNQPGNQGQAEPPSPTKQSPGSVQSQPPRQPISPALTKPPSEQVPRPDSPASPNYQYESLTDDIVQAWEERGRRDIVQHGLQAREDVDTTELSMLFQEFIQAVIESRIDAADAGASIKEILGEDNADAAQDADAFAPHTLFLDSFATIMENDPGLYRPTLRDFLIATGVSPTLMRLVLDAPILQQMGLVRDNFGKLRVRQATNFLYRQANYNLLREETEGYSKLITELFSTNSMTPPPPELAEQTFERMKGLIGTFDLDVGRVLDVTLDVAAAVLIKQYKFFVKFLRVSSWWPRSHFKYDDAYNGGLPLWANPGYSQWTVTAEDEAQIAKQKLARDVTFWERAREIHLGAFFELGGRRVSDLDFQQVKAADGRGIEETADFEQQWIEETNTRPPPGNRVAAQLLGFKLSFYNSKVRDKTDVLPANLLYLTALLIKVGFLSLTDLYLHLSPPDDDMEKVREEEAEKLEKEERAARGGGQMNALLMAGVLPQGDDDNPNVSTIPKREAPKKVDTETKQAVKEENDAKNKLPEPLEQKVSLLTQLLTIGAIPESLFILGRFPWIPEIFPEVLQRIHRILHVSLEKVYTDTRPVAMSTMDCPSKQLPDLDQTGIPKGSVRLVTQAPKKQWRWPFPEKFDVNENQNYRFYWDEWADNIPVCQTVDDVFTLCNTFLNISGVNIGRDEALLAKLAGIGSKSLADDKSDSNLNRWYDLLRRLMLPALSHTKANASVVNAIWGLLKHYPLTTRYSAYAEWFEGQTSRLPAMKSAFARATSETRGTMKRVSLTNLSEMAKQLAKTSYSSPGIVFRVAFEQLESYPNLIEAFVECAKYFTDLSYDVLIWSLLSSLGKSRSRTQAEHALTTSKWLQALSRFSGKVFRRYPVLSPTPILQYVNDQLFRGNATDLIILKEFVSSMGGIVDSVDFTDYQVLSMAGGACLRRHTLIRAQDRRFDNVKSSKRLIQALVDSKLAANLLLNLAQYRQAAIFQVPEDEAHIKYLSSVVDDSHQTLIQYLDLLWSNLDPGTFDAIVPSISELIATYGLDTSLAFLIGRTSLGHRIFPWKEGKGKKVAKSVTDKECDVDMAEANAQSEEPKESETQGIAGNEEQVCMIFRHLSGISWMAANCEQKSEDVSLTRTTVDALHPIIESVRSHIRPEVWQKISPELYTTFWALQLGDVCFPEETYVRERQRIMSDWQMLSSDRSDMSRKAVDRRNEKRKDLMDLQGYLLDELSEHGLRKAKWKYYLTKQFQTSFPDLTAKADTISDVLLEQCLLPRVLMSPADAEYTFRFIKALHEWNAPAFKLMSLYDRLFNANRLRSLIFTCTVREAEYFGRFLKLILEDLSRWHKNDPIVGDRDNKGAKDIPTLGTYDKEGKGLTEQPHFGFSLTVNHDGKPETFVGHAQFRDLLFRWHKNLNMALKNCLGGSEWMHIRNGITVLKTVLDFFPAIDFMATQFITQLQNITKREATAKISPDCEEGGRVDLSVAAQGAMSELQRRKSKWVMVQAFRQNADPGSRQESNKSSGPAFRPTAPDFKPHGDKTSITKNAAVEKEDGEVQDREGTREKGGSTPQEPVPPKLAGNARDSTKPGETPGQSRSSTPKPAVAKTEPRGHKLPDRPSHNLPSRPDVPIPGHFTSERFGQSRGHDRRDGRESRGHRDVRDVREGWDRDTRDARDVQDYRESRQSDSERLGRGRDFAERRAADFQEDLGRTELPPRPIQSERERPHREHRVNTQAHDRPPESATSEPTVLPEAREPVMNPERAALFAQDTPERPSRGPNPDRSSRGRRPGGSATTDDINLERAALIADRGNDTHNTPGRLNRDDGHESAGMGQSPRRSTRNSNEQSSALGGWEDRQARNASQDQRFSGREARDRSPPPGAFKGKWPMDWEDDRLHPDTMRDSSGFHRSVGRPQEAESRKSYQDQNYGRLNPVPHASNSDIPSGPRGRGRNTSRGGHGQPTLPGRPENRFAPPETPRPPSPERSGPPTGPPTGPSSGRYRRGYEPGSGPQTPAGTPAEASGRARNFNQSGEKPVLANVNATPTPVVHPERLAQLGTGPPSGPQGNQRHHGQVINTPDWQQPSPRGASGFDVETPTGPAMADRPGRGGGRRQLAGINSTLQQAQAKVPEPPRTSGLRMNQPRQMLGNSDIQVLAGGSSTSTLGQERHDTLWMSSNGGDNQARRDYDRSRTDRDGRSDRSNRTSRRNSRERDREGVDPIEGRERRSGGGPDSGDNREERESRRQPRNSMGPPSSASGRDSRYRNDGQPGGGNWGENRSGHRTSSGTSRGTWPRDGGNQLVNRRDYRDDHGRKRRSEEGVGNLTSEREKRPRR
ncbi:tho2 protein [Metarhizium album ARSEF 1941]|uniref:THO complex subunit 2 n=1 Tax=Metarhizium album (strain ARSEF 1941) TaxID=1081103 RepID=A0A0B2WUT8_METAS|nr:tho2 protein [Metarhizium album ARSEF 1941]KHN99821.1 tho2 protein [Metarhizium album ARSEF 1941]